jgi:3-isopropylmalate/(R)-2-methylmalate dehydratase small subunit
MEGLDDIGLTLRNTNLVDEFEAKRANFKPKTLPVLS